MKKYIALLCALLGVSCVPLAHAPNAHSVMVMEDETVLIRNKPLHVMCAGVWVDPHTIVTAGHCAQEAGITAEVAELCADDDLDELLCSMNNPVGKHLDIMTLDGTESQAVVKFIDPVHDVAVLHSDRPWHAWAKLAKESPPDGANLNVIGHTAAYLWTYTRGYVAKAHRKENCLSSKERVDWMQVSAAPLYGGNSGGGAFDDEGHLTGLLSFLLVNTPSVGFFVSLPAIKAAMEHR